MLRQAHHSYSQAMEERGSVLARRSLLIIGVLMALAGLYIVVQPVDANDFQGTTGVVWSDFQNANPEPAAYLEREGRLLGVSFAFLGIVAAGMSATVLRRNDRSAWIVAWFLPLTLASAAAVFFGGDGAMLGAFYAVAALTAGTLVAIGTRTAS